MRKFLALALIAGTALLSACGGGSDDPPLVAASNATLAVNPVAAVAVAQTPFAFPAGVPDLGTTAATTVVFTSTASSPAFSIASGGATATGVTTFGSCVFAITSSTFPAGHRLAQGNVITVNPCNLNVGTAGAQANGVGASRSVALQLGAAASSGASVTVAVNPGGQLTLNGTSVGTVTLTPVSGG
jgi:hypothetical protein